MNLFTIPPDRPFLDVLAAWWLQGSGDDPLAVADGLILLPTRRAARSLTEAFLRASAGRPLMLPRIVALGAFDETPLALAGALDLVPAVDPQTRLAVLARLIMAFKQTAVPRSADGAWRLARDLASLLDEAYRAGVSLPDKLPIAVAADYADHWKKIVDFLAVVTTQWPLWLADNGLVDAADRALKLLEVQRVSWDAEPPPFRVVVAGTTGGIPRVAALMQVVARLERGSVILPGLDLEMDETVWAKLDDGHPQAGMAALLRQMDATRGDVRVLEVESREDGRVATIRRALLPAAALHTWRDPFRPEIAGWQRLEPADQQEEAVAIALALRAALETPNARAALVTPDRALALRVAAELTRFGVIVDDSAGEALADTPPATFLRLLARAVADGLSPVALLAVLKHPLAGFGLTPRSCRTAARALERRVLRGPAPPPGVAGLRAAYAESMTDRRGGKRPPDARIDDLLDRLDARLAPLLALVDREHAAPAEALAALIETAERAAETDSETGGARLWALEEGEALATHLSELTDALPYLTPQKLTVLPGLLDATMEGAVARSRRALRGREGAEHPRIAILGLLEARLQSFDVLVLGGLVEGIWPAATDPGPWMSRQMRKAVGLTSPEERVGQMAHDFAAFVCAAPSVILSCPLRRDGAPAVPARWLVRLNAFLGGHGAALPAHPAARWAALLDQPDGDPRPVQPPTPRPPVAQRPRKLSVTEIETWLRDPYAIFAKHVLGLRALDPLEQNADNADYGNVVHRAVAEFIRGLTARYPADAARRLRAEMDAALDARALRPALTAWWRPRLHRIADWLAEEEGNRRADRSPSEVGCEIRGEWAVPDDAAFTLTGIADRIERLAGGAVSILDYKTGAVPTMTAVENGFASQLVLEAAMARDGAFGTALTGEAGELAYWRLSGGMPAGEIKAVFKKKDITDEVHAAVTSLIELIRSFDRETTPYLSRPHPANGPRFSDYAQLARVGEWSVLEDDG